MTEMGMLYICPTPIGNLADITLRVLDTLKKVDFIAAEDTRHSKKLLDHYHIQTSLISYHEHNEKMRSLELVKRLKEGQSGALISDAGMPGISDPGQVLIQLCIQEEIPIDVLPGPNAALTALVLSGMPTDSFLYAGFLPSHKSERKKMIEKISKLPYTIILYEAPHRLVSTLQTIKEVIDKRQAAVTRELTKIHQTVYRGDLQTLIEIFQKTPIKGECCILLAPYEEIIEKGKPSDWLAEIERMVADGFDSKEALKKVAKKYGISKREVYQARLDKV